MTLLSRKADYALLILSYLYHNATGGTARAIAAQFELSRPFVANILKELCSKGFVISHRGVKGGYSLARDAAQISLADLLEAIEDGFQLTVCSDNHTPGDACTHARACTVKGPIAEVHQRLMGVLRGVTLAELFDPKAAPAAGRSLPVLPTIQSCCSNMVESVKA
ncbi:MAG: Rrf2 family transcriptional regulator [Gemmataceae bacterium]|nr:Rrf2 family transcriptional regulator [Gemmata sp.]MDW8197531.1 Rrf2 family transcriptional regulator [Gemmataceae bacterium]